MNVPALRFKDDDGQEFPEWEEKTLGEVGNSFNGLTGKSGDDFGIGLPYITYKQIFDANQIDVTNFSFVRIDKDEKQNKVQFLMIRRKDSFGYIDFIRGKYSPYNICQIQNIIDEMSIDEKARILDGSFEKLWEKMWGNIINTQYKNEEVISSKKMD